MSSERAPARERHGDDRRAAAKAVEEREPEPFAVRMPVDVRNVALTIIAVVAVLLVLRLAQGVLIPIVLGILISYALGPLVNALARIKVPRAIGAAVAVSILVGSLGTGIYVLSDEALAFVASVPQAAQRIRARLTAHRRSQDGALQQVQRAATEIEKTAQATQPDTPPPSGGVTRVQVVQPAFRATDYLWIGGAGIVGFVGQLAIILLLAYFLLVTGDLYKRKLVKIAGPRLSQQKITVQILDEINEQIEGFIRVQVLMSLLVAVATGVTLWWLGLEQFAIWGLLAGVLNSIPYLGPVVITGGLGVVAFLQFDDLAKTAYVCGAALAITSIEGYLLTPTLMGRAARMNPVAVFVGLLFWTWIWGAWGTILAVPMLMMVKVICDHVEDFQPVGELLGD
jgi:predicted PurR-regulated permease PerM